MTANIEDVWIKWDPHRKCFTVTTEAGFIEGQLKVPLRIATSMNPDVAAAVTALVEALDKAATARLQEALTEGTSS